MARSATPRPTIPSITQSEGDRERREDTFNDLREEVRLDNLKRLRTQIDPIYANTSWKWDATRGKYWRYDGTQNCYIYEDGERLALYGQAQRYVKPAHHKARHR